MTKCVMVGSSSRLAGPGTLPGLASGSAKGARAVSSTPPLLVPGLRAPVCDVSSIPTAQRPGTVDALGRGRVGFLWTEGRSMNLPVDGSNVAARTPASRSLLGWALQNPAVS